jgi:hypothetical protein
MLYRGGENTLIKLVVRWACKDHVLLIVRQ